MIGDPPVVSGAIQLRATCPAPATPDTERGADGVDKVLTGAEAAEGLLQPTPFWANTRNV